MTDEDRTYSVTDVGCRRGQHSMELGRVLRNNEDVTARISLGNRMDHPGHILVRNVLNGHAYISEG